MTKAAPPSPQRAGRAVMRGLLDVALAVQIIVERIGHIVFSEAEQGMDTRRLDVGIDHANALALVRQHQQDGCRAKHNTEKSDEDDRQDRGAPAARRLARAIRLGRVGRPNIGRQNRPARGRW